MPTERLKRTGALNSGVRRGRSTGSASRLTGSSLAAGRVKQTRITPINSQVKKQNDPSFLVDFFRLIRRGKWVVLCLVFFAWWCNDFALPHKVAAPGEQQTMVGKLVDTVKSIVSSVSTVGSGVAGAPLYSDEPVDALLGTAVDQVTPKVTSKGQLLSKWQNGIDQQAGLIGQVLAECDSCQKAGIDFDLIAALYWHESVMNCQFRDSPSTDIGCFCTIDAVVEDHFGIYDAYPYTALDTVFKKALRNKLASQKVYSQAGLDVIVNYASEWRRIHPKGKRNLSANVKHDFMLSMSCLAVPYLIHNYRQFNSDLYLALAGYNIGITTVDNATDLIRQKCKEEISFSGAISSRCAKLHGFEAGQASSVKLKKGFKYAIDVMAKREIIKKYYKK